MHPIQFPGSREIGKPEGMTDEQCFSVWATDTAVSCGPGANGEEITGRMWTQAWQPSKEDIEAINRGEPIYIQIHSRGLPPIAVFTLDENGNSNDAD